MAQKSGSQRPVTSAVARKSPRSRFRGPREWLPNGAHSGRIVSDVVVDVFAARKHLGPRKTAFCRPPVQTTLAFADELKRRLDGGDVNQSELSHLHGMTRARVTQVLNLLRLHPMLLAFLRNAAAGPRSRLLTERRLRPLLQLEPLEQIDAAMRLIPELATAIPPATRGARRAHKGRTP